MATYESTIAISANEAALIRRYMDNEPANENECFYSDDSFCYGTTFPNGYSMELWCNGVGCFDEGAVNTAWGEALLFDEYGCETDDDISEGSSEFFSTWSLEGSDGNSYLIDIIVSKED